MRNAHKRATISGHAFVYAERLFFLFQEVGALRLDHLHNSDDHIVGMAGLLLRPEVQVDTRQRQAFGECTYFLFYFF